MDAEVTRATLRRALVVNALTKALNVSVATAVVVAGVVLGVSWLFAVALVTYVVLAALTFFDEAEARRVGEETYGRVRVGPGRERVDPGRLAAPIAAQLSAGLAEEARIRRAIEQADLPLDDVEAEVSSLVGSMGESASRAQLVYDYLASQNPRRVEQRIAELRRSAQPDDPTVQRTIAALSDQRDAQMEMVGQLERFYAEMEQTVASLSTIHARILRMGLATEQTGEEQLTGQVRELREQVDALSQGMSEAYERPRGEA